MQLPALARWTTTLELTPILDVIARRATDPLYRTRSSARWSTRLRDRMALGYPEPLHLVSLKAHAYLGPVMLANLILALEEEPWWPGWELDGLPEPPRDNIRPTPEAWDGWRFFVQLPAEAWKTFHPEPPPPAPEG